MSPQSTVFAVVVAVATLLSGCTPPAPTSSSAPSASPTPDSSGVTATAPDTIEPADSPAAAVAADDTKVALKVANLEQLDQAIRGFAGKVVVVDIWSTSCAPCMHEFPNLVALSNSSKEQVACISLNVDYIGLKSKPPESYAPKVEDFLQKQQATLLNLLSTDADEKVLSHFKLEALPAILIYAADGSLQHSLTDVNSGDDGLTYAGDVIPKVEALVAASK